MPSLPPLVVVSLLCSTASAQAAWSLLHPPVSPPPRFASEVQRVPQGSVPVFFATGFATAANSLTALGMPGCTQHVAPLVSDLRVGSR